MTSNHSCKCSKIFYKVLNGHWSCEDNADEEIAELKSPSFQACALLTSRYNYLLTNHKLETKEILIQRFPHQIIRILVHRLLYARFKNKTIVNFFRNLSFGGLFIENMIYKEISINLSHSKI